MTDPQVVERVQAALLSTDNRLLDMLFSPKYPLRGILQPILNSGKVLPQHIPTLYRAMAGVSWCQCLDAWARGGHCVLVETLCKTRDQTPVMLILTGHYFDLNNLLDWCPCCCAKIFTLKSIRQDMNNNMDTILSKFGKIHDSDALPDWLVLLLPHTSFRIMLRHLKPRHCYLYLHELAMKRLKDPEFAQEVVGAGQPNQLLPNLRKLGIRMDFALLIDATYPTFMYQALSYDIGWRDHIHVTNSDAREYAKKIPYLTPFLHPHDICSLDVVHWADKWSASVAAALLENANPKIILASKASTGYVLRRSGLPRAVKRLAGEVAVNLLLFTKRPGLWSRIDPWVIRHMVSFLK
jgi:hypothetical protein